MSLSHAVKRRLTFGALLVLGVVAVVFALTSHRPTGHAYRTLQTLDPDDYMPRIDYCDFPAFEDVCP